MTLSASGTGFFASMASWNWTAIIASAVVVLLVLVELVAVVVVAEFVDLSDPLVIAGLQLLVQQAFLTQARAGQILNNELPDV